MDPGSTRARELHWVVRGGTARLPDGRLVPIDVDPVVVGRDPGAHIVVDDPEVSALHCELRAVDDGVLVRDLESTNGTFAMGLRIRGPPSASTSATRTGSVRSSDALRA